MLLLQQFLGKPQCCAEAQGGVGYQGASPDVAELSGAVVHGSNNADNVAALCLFEQVFEIPDDDAIGRPPYELQDV